MKVLHLFNEVSFSGAEVMYCSAAPIFIASGCSLIAYSTGKTIGGFANEFEKAGIKVVHKPINFNLFSITGYRYYKSLFRFLKKEKVDVLQIHRNDLYFAAVIAYLANVKCIKTQHNVFRNRWFSIHIAIFKRFITRTLFNTIYQTIGESVYRNELRYYRNPSVRINNWYNESKFYPAIDGIDRMSIRNQLNIAKETFVVITAGSCSHSKNHSDIIKAISLVNEQLDCVFLHLGSGVEEHEEKKISVELGIADKIHFLGNQVDVRQYLIASDLFLMTSKFEGLSIATLEAMGCGLPLVLYDVPGLRDLINNDDSGFLIETDFKVLAEKILYLIRSPLIMKKMSLNAYSEVNKHYSRINNVRKMLLIYNSEATYKK